VPLVIQRLSCGRDHVASAVSLAKDRWGGDPNKSLPLCVGGYRVCYLLNWGWRFYLERKTGYHGSPESSRPWCMRLLFPLPHKDHVRLSPLPLYCGEYVPKARRTPLGLTISHKSFVDLQASTHNSLAVNSVPPCCNKQCDTLMMWDVCMTNPIIYNIFIYNNEKTKFTGPGCNI